MWGTVAQPLNLEDFVWATGAFCQLNRIPYDAALLIKQYPPPYDVVNLQQGFGLNNSLKLSTLSQLQNASLSCLAILKLIPPLQTPLPPANDSNIQGSILEPALEPIPERQASATHSIALILKRDEQRLLVLPPNQAEPITVSPADIADGASSDNSMPVIMRL